MLGVLGVLSVIGWDGMVVCLRLHQAIAHAADVTPGGRRSSEERRDAGGPGSLRPPWLDGTPPAYICGFWWR
jgi:hypothetical protein